MIGQTSTQLDDTYNGVVILPRSGVIDSRNGHLYGVVFNGKLCSPEWLEKGPAEAYLTALLSGTRQPEYRS